MAASGSLVFDAEESTIFVGGKGTGVTSAFLFAGGETATAGGGVGLTSVRLGGATTTVFVIWISTIGLEVAAAGGGVTAGLAASVFGEVASVKGFEETASLAAFVGAVETICTEGTLVFSATGGTNFSDETDCATGFETVPISFTTFGFSSATGGDVFAFVVARGATGAVSIWACAATGGAFVFSITGVGEFAEEAACSRGFETVLISFTTFGFSVAISGGEFVSAAEIGLAEVTLVMTGGGAMVAGGGEACAIFSGAGSSGSEIRSPGGLTCHVSITPLRATRKVMNGLTGRRVP